MKYIVVIPSRYASTRFPGKALVDLDGKTMIQRVYEQCLQAVPADLIYVATEDKRIQDHCKKLGIQCLMTSDKCLTGTDRVAEVAEQIDADYYINLQGDEPLFSPNDIKSIVNAVSKKQGAIYNGYCKIYTETDHKSVSVPKVVFRQDGRLLYMSRAPIPGNKSRSFHFGYRQVCIYGFPKESLKAFTNVDDKTPFENEEDIEILRFLEMGYEVEMIEMSSESIPIDNPEDVEKVLNKLRDGQQ